MAGRGGLAFGVMDFSFFAHRLGCVVWCRVRDSPLTARADSGRGQKDVPSFCLGTVEDERNHQNQNDDARERV